MSEIVKELRTHASHCRACGESTTADILLHAVDWIQVQQATIQQQKMEISEMGRALGKELKRQFGPKKKVIG